MPEVVLSLDAQDDFLKQRVMNLPEQVVAGTHNTEAGLIRRLAEFRSLNEEDNTVLNYFDELEIHPEHIGEIHNKRSLDLKISMWYVSEQSDDKVHLFYRGRGWRYPSLFYFSMASVQWQH